MEPAEIDFILLSARLQRTRRRVSKQSGSTPTKRTATWPFQNPVSPLLARVACCLLDSPTPLALRLPYPGSPKINYGIPCHSHNFQTQTRFSNFSLTSFDMLYLPRTQQEFSFNLARFDSNIYHRERSELKANNFLSS